MSDSGIWKNAKLDLLGELFPQIRVIFKLSKWCLQNLR